MRRRGTFVLGLALVGLMASMLPAGAVGETQITVGSIGFPFGRNKQNEPAIAVDPNHPTLLVAGANDNIDLEDCNSGADTTCPFTAGVGTTGIAFSTDGGTTWTQPTFTGYSARGCTGVDDAPGATPTDACVPNPAGPIGTLPWYFENGVVADGDPALAFGPAPDGDGGFHWAGGSRLYVANLTGNFASKHSEGAFKAEEAIGVSGVDIPLLGDPGAVLGDKGSWMPPSLIPPGGNGFADKEQIWADNAESSAHFGNVYVCLGNFVGGSGAGTNAVRLTLATSTDGGDTWAQTVVEHNNATSSSGKWALVAGATGCTIRTDSEGTVYVFWHGFNQKTKEEAIFLSRSLDGGVTFEPRGKLFSVHQTGVFDPVIGRNTMDGIAGARSDLSTAPSVDIANGSPSGAGATDQIVLTWVDGETLNDEHVLVSTSTDGGDTWAPPRTVEDEIAASGDRGYYSAAAISPDGEDVWIVYNAFTTPYQTTTSAPRPLLAVVAHADVVAGAMGTFFQLHRSVPGDARSASQNDLTAEFLGDYVYAAARNDYGALVWNDVRDGLDCPAIDAWRQALRTKSTVDDPPRPEPNNDCSATGFGNSSIYGGGFPDPTP